MFRIRKRTWRGTLIALSGITGITAEGRKDQKRDYSAVETLWTKIIFSILHYSIYHPVVSGN